MTKRRHTKPRWDWRIRGHSVDTDKLFSDELVRDLERDLAIKDEQTKLALSSALLIAADNYWLIETSKDWPSRPQIRNAISLIVVRSRELVELLERLDDRSRMWLVNEFADQSPRGRSLRPDDTGELPYSDHQERSYAELTEELKALRDGGHKLLEKLNPSGPKGRPANKALSELICHVAEIYSEFTGTDPRMGFSFNADDGIFDGPFFVFAEKCVRAITTNKERTNNALGEAIRRALGWRK